VLTLNSATDDDLAPKPAREEVASYLTKLNEAQREAVEYGTQASSAGDPAGALLVIAGAGSGKTNTLAHRVAHLLVRGADPHRILLLTFSRRAASEMTRRVTRIAVNALGNRSVIAQGLTWSGTFHSVGARLLRDYADLVGLSPSFTINDREDSADLMNLVRHELGLSAKEKRFPAKSTCFAIYSRVVNTGVSLATVLDQAFPWCREWEDDLRRLFAAYVNAKQQQSVLDYDDLLLYWSHLAAEPSIAADLSSRFDHVLVDEYQDTNKLQASILLSMKPDGRGLTVVGDDAQSIYSFRGATVRNILDFPNHFNPPAKCVTLERNYRSTQPILAASNAVIGLAAERYTKNLWTDKASAQRPRLVSVADEADQARYIVEQVLEAREGGMTLKQQAVLFRAAHHSAALEIELTRRNIPFVKFGGLKFLDSVHVKDVLAVLRWGENPRDRVAGFRVLQLLPGVGPAIAGRVLDQVAERSIRCAVARERRLAGARRDDVEGLRARKRLARGIRNDPALVRTASGAQPRRRVNSSWRCVADGKHRVHLSHAGAFSHRTDARSARCHQRRIGCAAHRRGLSDSLHHPLREGPGVEECVRAEWRGWLHSIGYGHGQRRGNR
jgi:DNA helicase-2/ATP-dependent DNA helicase PcrA